MVDTSLHYQLIFEGRATGLRDCGGSPLQIRGSDDVLSTDGQLLSASCSLVLIGIICDDITRNMSCVKYAVENYNLFSLSTFSFIKFTNLRSRNLD